MCALHNFASVTLQGPYLSVHSPGTNADSGGL